MAGKIVRAQRHHDFEALFPHLKLLLELGNFSQFSACKISADPKEKETNNKIFELYVATILFQICSNLKLDDPKSSKGDNPDVIGEYNLKRWAFACKVSHSKNPLSFLQRVRDGVDQIEDKKTKADRVLVVVNFKNLRGCVQSSCWPEPGSRRNRDPVNSAVMGCAGIPASSSVRIRFNCPMVTRSTIPEIFTLMMF